MTNLPMPLRLPVLMVLVWLAEAPLSAATQIHVAPGGNDANPGTAAQPVATPQGAQVRVRSLIGAGLSNRWR